MIAFPDTYMVQSIFIYMKWFLCSAHLNFGNSTHKFLHINQILFNFPPPQLGTVPESVYALETHPKYKIYLY